MPEARTVARLEIVETRQALGGVVTAVAEPQKMPCLVREITSTGIWHAVGRARSAHPDRPRPALRRLVRPLAFVALPESRTNAIPRVAPHPPPQIEIHASECHTTALDLHLSRIEQHERTNKDVVECLVIAVRIGNARERWGQRIVWIGWIDALRQREAARPESGQYETNAFGTPDTVELTVRSESPLESLLIKVGHKDGGVVACSTCVDHVGHHDGDRGGILTHHRLPFHTVAGCHEGLLLGERRRHQAQDEDQEKHPSTGSTLHTHSIRTSLNNSSS